MGRDVGPQVAEHLRSAIRPFMFTKQLGNLKPRQRLIISGTETDRFRGLSSNWNWLGPSEGFTHKDRKTLSIQIALYMF